MNMASSALPAHDSPPAEHLKDESSQKTAGPSARESSASTTRNNLQRSKLPPQAHSESDEGHGRVASAYEEVLRLRRAWDKTAERTFPYGESRQDVLPVEMPCLACVYDGEGSLTARMLRRTGLGEEKPLRQGTHAFVILAGEEPLIRVGLMVHDFWKACGHPQISREQAVLFAGDNMGSCGLRGP
jgi:hypothetical protein